MSAPAMRVSSLALPAVAAVAAFAPWPPGLVERAYALGLYPRIQPVLTSLSNRVPFAWLDVLVLALAGAGAAGAVVAWRRRRSAVRWAIGGLVAAIECAAVAYLVFLVAWGLNYRRAPAEERLRVDAERVNGVRLRVLAARAVDEVNALAAERRDEHRLGLPDVVEDLAPGFAAAAAESGVGWHVVPGRPKRSVLSATFPWAAVDGMVNPFGLEVILNPEVLPFERPFVVAHEWGHLAGFADESEASFAGFLTCLRGPATARYSGWLSLGVLAWRALPPAEARAVTTRLGPQPRADLRAIAARVARAKPLVHAVSWRVYDQYLRANRVEEGVANYDAVTRLVLGSAITASLSDGPPAR
jgi:hypothetical protein